MTIAAFEITNGKARKLTDNIGMNFPPQRGQKIAIGDRSFVVARSFIDGSYSGTVFVEAAGTVPPTPTTKPTAKAPQPQPTTPAPAPRPTPTPANPLSAPAIKPTPTPAPKPTAAPAPKTAAPTIGEMAMNLTDDDEGAFSLSEFVVVSGEAIHPLVIEAPKADTFEEAAFHELLHSIERGEIADS